MLEYSANVLSGKITRKDNKERREYKKEEVAEVLHGIPTQANEVP